MKHKRVKSSSIIEVVVAISIISICFTVATLIFSRLTNTAQRFEDIKKQTELQSEILEKMFLSNFESVNDTDVEQISIEKELDIYEKRIENIYFKTSQGKTLWVTSIVKK